MSGAAEAMAGPGPGVLARLARMPFVTLALLCLVLWTPGVFSLPPLDRDESRFAQSSKQMLETDNFVDIRFGRVPRYKKPVGIYWLQAATTEVAGFGARNHIWTYRLASLIGGVAAVWLTFWTGLAFASAEVAWLGAALLGASLLLTAESTIATTDAVLLACTMGAQGVLLRIYLAARDPSGTPPSRATVLLGWLALGLGALVKGPVTLAVGAVTVIALVAWDRDWRWLKATRPLIGVPLALAVVAPWAIAIALESHGQFYQQSLGNDFAAKIAGGQESHGAPPGYFLALASLTLWPATLFLIPGIATGVAHRREPAIRFLLAWAGAAWLMFELVPTKLPHYILPAYPALALLCAVWALAPGADARRWPSVAAAIQFALGVLCFAAVPFILPRLYGDGAPALLMVLAILGAAVGVAAAFQLLRGRRLSAAAFAGATALVFYPTLTLGVAPGLQTIWVSPRVAAIVAKDALPGDPPPALAGYEEPSLVYLLGTDTRLTNGAGAADATADQGGVAVVEDHERAGFLARLSSLGAEPYVVGTLDGLNYSRGKRVHITVYRVSPAQQETAPPPE
jgi:4-amino-4-deoxy-L-arabinose transferase-like glycosyltransferase